ncbi:Pyruvate dehydrogenase phosphatase [Fasciola gigantica]|uniref:Pyruvate dehydrogenase phosphatase n=1 Tax=Fasciola gigantica TaxID=46835 RepID=A0A504YT81_FASGI|nr:Pyruvate dehydrogenase phosphatase [Fasciola gigantica]
MCAHTLAWSLLDYVAASFLDTEKLVLALNHWRTHGLDQPYHLARRLDLLASTDHRRLGHAASAPAPQLSAHIRLCLQDYVKDLVERIDRNMDPEQCMIEAMLRMDDVLCSTHYEIDLHSEPPPPSPSALPQDLTLARELLRVALSGAVGITGRLFWQQTEDSHSAQLHLANVGDCGAVLLRLVNPSDEYCEEPLLEAVSCSRPHQGACNSDEIARVVQEHPENNPSDLFREGGRLLGELAPSRAFGNVRYKWPAKRVLELSKVLDRLYSSTSDNGTVSHPGSGIIGAGSGSLRRDAAAAASSLFPMPAPYTSPPYLTAKPDVTHFEITPAYRYLVLGTDGLWDLLSSREVALIMQEELCKSGSPATRLLWNCLTSIPPSMARVIAQDSSNDSQPPVAKPSIERADSKAFSRALKLLSLPPGLARYYRDDITVMVIELAAGR